MLFISNKIFYNFLTNTLIALNPHRVRILAEKQVCYSCGNITYAILKCFTVKGLGVCKPKGLPAKGLRKFTIKINSAVCFLFLSTISSQAASRFGKL
jgi:hypothetical protein